MPSRRHVLFGGGLALAGAAGSSRLLESPMATDNSAAVEWPTPRCDAAGTGFNPDASGPKDDVQLTWECEPETNISGPAPPIAVGETLYVTGRGGIVAIDRETGRVRFERNGDSYLSAPTVATTTAYRADTLAVSGTAGIYGLSADGGYRVAGQSIGLERWHAPGREPSLQTVGPPTNPAPVAVDGVVYALVPETSRIVALNADSGRARWEYTIGDAQVSDPNRPVVRDGTVYVTSWPDHAVAIDAESGADQWIIEITPKDPERENDYRSVVAPTATDSGLVVPSRRAVTLLDSTDGSRLWEYVHDGSLTDGSVAVADGTVFVADGESSIHAIDLETGEADWTAEYSHDVPPVVADGVVYLGYYWLPELVAIDAETGERRWTHEVGHGLSQPIVGDGALYVVGHRRVVALEEAE